MNSTQHSFTMQLPFTNQRSTLMTLLFLGLFITSNAQPVPMKWGKVPAEDLNMTTYEADPDADAVVLGAYEMVYVNMRQEYAVSYEVHIRMKILTQEGVDRADITIPYGKKERLTGLQAQTINQGETTKVSKKDVFDEEVTKTYSRKRFTFPNVQVGSVIEYRYTLESPYAGILDTWYFQDDIPVRRSECRFSVPLYIEYVMITNTDRPFDIKEDKRISIGNDEGRIYRFVMEDMQGLEEETYITTMTDYLNNIQLQAAKLTQPNGIINRYWKDWPDLIDTWWDADSGGKQVKNKGNNKKILQDVELATSIKDDKERAVAIYNFIKNNYTWNERFSDYAQEKKLNIAYEKSAGNSAEINLSLLASLLDSGIEAHPVRISTRSHGRIQKLYPIVAQFNHVVILARIDGKEYLLDAIDKDLTFGMLHPQSLNLQGLLLERTKQKIPTWIDLIPNKSTEIVNINLQVGEDEPLAELTGVYTGYSAWGKRYQRRTNDEEDYIEERLGDLYDFEVESVEFNTKKPERFAEVVKLKVEDAVTTSADNIYINPFLMEQTEERIFTLEKRAYPVDIAAPYMDKYILNLTIPEGYEVAELPENIKMTLPDGSGSYFYMIEQKNNILQLRSEETLKKPIFFPEEYEALKELFDLIFEKEAEQIILKKK